MVRNASSPATDRTFLVSAKCLPVNCESVNMIRHVRGRPPNTRLKSICRSGKLPVVSEKLQQMISAGQANLEDLLVNEFDSVDTDDVANREPTGDQ